jgi:hypothetical protein
MACGNQTPFPACGVRGPCPVNGLGIIRHLFANFLNEGYSGLSQMKLKSHHFENYPISGNQKPLRAFFTHIWGYFVQCDYTLLRMTDQ